MKKNIRHKIKITNRKRLISFIGISYFALILCFALLIRALVTPIFNPRAEGINRRQQMVSFGLVKFEPLKETSKTVLYIDNTEQPKIKGKVDLLGDNKLLEYADGSIRLTDFCTGFTVEIPENMEPDFTHSPSFVMLNSDYFSLTISREYSPYDDMDGYIEHYLNRFITNKDYREGNNIELLKDTTEKYANNNVRIISVRVLDMPEDKKDVYTYATINTGKKEFFRMMFKFRLDDSRQIEQLTSDVLKSFERRNPLGTAFYDLHLEPTEPDFWSSDTQKLYHSMKNRDDILWGIFTAQVQDEGINKTIPRIERKIDYKFPILLIYNHLGKPLPEGFAQKCAEQNRMIELTIQMTETNNENLFTTSPLLELYKGNYDEEVRSLARQIKEEIKLPFFCRLNNEMNTDWTSYSGIVTLSDPEIYVEGWRRIYEIFKEEGVDNAIWVFNPNDRNFPPCNWNNFMGYYPGDEYVQMIGITGYNTGTYFQDVTGEQWRSFTEIYDGIEEAYNPFFSEFPWIITEFSTSSVGGDKPQWIDRMFKHIQSYPNIKAAVWFSAADMDSRPGHEGEIGRPYMLDETEESLKAFARGIKKLDPPQAGEQ